MHIHLVEACPRGEMLDVAGAQVVEDHDLMAVGQEPVSNVGSDKPRAAGDQDLQRRWLSRKTTRPTLKRTTSRPAIRPAAINSPTMKAGTNRSGTVARKLIRPLITSRLIRTRKSSARSLKIVPSPLDPETSVCWRSRYAR